MRRPTMKADRDDRISKIELLWSEFVVQLVSETLDLSGMCRERMGEDWDDMMDRVSRRSAEILGIVMLIAEMAGVSKSRLMKIERRETLRTIDQAYDEWVCTNKVKPDEIAKFDQSRARLRESLRELCELEDEE